VIGVALAAAASAAPPLLLSGLATAAPPLDLNSATAEQLELLPSVGPVRAAAFLEWRAVHGRCVSLADLAAVPGFGTATLATLEGRAWCGSHDGAATKLTAAGPAVVRPGTIDVNTASVDELQRLPGIVEARARAIVDDRERNGPFASCAELVRVPGIGPATVANLDRTCAAGPVGN
jgi:competence protein ComEA